MRILATLMPGAAIIRGLNSVYERGWFWKTFRQRQFIEAGIESNCCEVFTHSRPPAYRRHAPSRPPERQRLAGLPGVSMNPEHEGTVIGAWMPTVVFAPETGITREKLQAAFAAENADVRVFFWPLSMAAIQFADV